MEDNAMISLSTIQYAEEGEDKIELMTKGRFAEKDGYMKSPKLRALREQQQP